MILSQHEGGQCLDDTTHIVKDKALRLITNQSVLTPQAIGIWLRRLGKDNQGIKALQKVNKANAQWTYKKHKGYMPIIGHIAQTGQIVATNFRTGNVSPAKDNLDFIKISQDALPKGTNIKKLRIDAAGYQANIIDYCFEHNIEFSIRAKICQSLKDIFVDKDNQWQPLVDKKGGSC